MKTRSQTEEAVALKTFINKFCHIIPAFPNWCSLFHFLCAPRHHLRRPVHEANIYNQRDHLKLMSTEWCRSTFNPACEMRTWRNYYLSPSWAKYSLPCAHHTPVSLLPLSRASDAESRVLWPFGWSAWNISINWHPLLTQISPLKILMNCWFYSDQMDTYSSIIWWHMILIQNPTTASYNKSMTMLDRSENVNFSPFLVWQCNMGYCERIQHFPEGSWHHSYCTKNIKQMITCNPCYFLL